MGGINVNRWLLGGLVAALVIWLLEGAGSMRYLADRQAATEKVGLKFWMTPPPCLPRACSRARSRAC